MVFQTSRTLRSRVNDYALQRKAIPYISDVYIKRVVRFLQIFEYPISIRHSIIDASAGSGNPNQSLASDAYSKHHCTFIQRDEIDIISLLARHAG